MVILFFVNNTHADLNLIGQGTTVHGTYNLIYDTDFDITWYDYTIARDTWQNQVDWASGLTVDFGGAIYSDWRLPTALNQDGTGPCSNQACPGSEMGHLFYTELGHTEGQSLSNTGDFQNLLARAYWFSTEYTPNPSLAYHFGFAVGSQDPLNKNDNHYALAVMDGLAVVPEPVSSVLFITGGLFLGGRKYLKKYRT